MFLSVEPIIRKTAYRIILRYAVFLALILPQKKFLKNLKKRVKTLYNFNAIKYNKDT